MSIAQVETTAVTPFADGAAFGAHGAYERVDGFVELAVDPAHPRNRAITNLALAPPGEDGRVRARAPFIVLRPAEPARGSGKLLVDIVNRGRRLALRFFNSAPDGPQSEPLDAGNGFLMRHGFTVAWCGWQHDIPPLAGNLGIEVPQARNPDGTAVRGRIRVQFRPDQRTPVRLLSDREHRPYPAADCDEAGATLVVRRHEAGPGALVPRARWRFASPDGGPSPEHVHLEDGFEPGAIYEVTYTTEHAPVIGLGLLMIRDFASHLRYRGALPVTGALTHAYAFGASQSGRFLRRFLLTGLNVDEDGRAVFDGVIPHIAGGGSGEFNQRFGQPSSTAKVSVGNRFPFSDVVQTDAELGASAGILDEQRRAGGLPRIVFTNTSTEYWRGDAALIHVSPDGAADLESSQHARIYHFAGTQHVMGGLPLTDAHPLLGRVRYLLNCVDYSPLLRAVLLNLDAWCTRGEEPPPACHPRLGDRTLEPIEGTLAALGRLPIPQLPQHVAAVPRLDLGPQAAHGIVRWPHGAAPAASGRPYPLLTPSVDGDGNERAGIRLPDVSVPLGTSAGWNLRHPEHGASDQLAALAGAFFPFAATARSRPPGDPRPSVRERYPDRAAFAALTRAAAEALVGAGHLLDEDVDRIVDQGCARYDALDR